MKLVKVLPFVALIIMAVGLVSWTGCSKDTTPPTISGVNTSNITETSATITWTTNEVATSQILYDFSTNYSLSTALSSSRVIDHSMKLTGLDPNTTYHFKILSNDQAGNTGQSSDQTFRTLPIDLVFNHTGWKDTSYNDYHITFTVQNRSQLTLYIVVELKLYNSSDVSIYTYTATCDHLDSGETWKQKPIFGNHFYPDVARYNATIKQVTITDFPEPINTTDVVLLGQYPKVISDYHENLDIVLKNQIRYVIQSVTLEIKYYWPEDGTLRLTQQAGVGPIDPRESYNPGVGCIVGDNGNLYSVFILSYS